MALLGSLDAAFPTVRRYVLLVAGLLGVGYETLYDKGQKPALLILLGGMMGLSELVHALWRSIRKGDLDDE